MGNPVRRNLYCHFIFADKKTGNTCMTLPKPSGLQPPSRGRFGLKPPGSAVSSEEAGPAQANSKPTSLSGVLLSSKCKNSFYLF